jgi:hypothetical protein
MARKAAAHLSIETSYRNAAQRGDFSKFYLFIQVLPPLLE